MSMFGYTEAYRSSWQSFLSLYGAILGNFDFEQFGAPEDASETILAYADKNALVGQVVLTVYLLFVMILLLNLLVARMSATHQRIEEQDIQKWLFFKAEIVKEYHILYNRSSFSMIPSPLNLPVILFTFFGGLDWMAAKYLGISLGDTISNYILG